MKEGAKVRIVNRNHLLNGVVGRIIRLKTYRKETRVLVAFGNFEQAFDVKDVKKLTSSANEISK